MLSVIWRETQLVCVASEPGLNTHSWTLLSVGSEGTERKLKPHPCTLFSHCQCVLGRHTVLWPCFRCLREPRDGALKQWSCGGGSPEHLPVATLSCIQHAGSFLSQALQNKRNSCLCLEMDGTLLHVEPPNSYRSHNRCLIPTTMLGSSACYNAGPRAVTEQP